MKADGHLPPSGPDSATGATGPGGKCPVLLVDDDVYIHESVGSILSHLGYIPVLASTGEEALVLLKAGLEPVLLILDMDMPGMGGAAALPLIRTLRPKLPVVIATGRLNSKVIELAACYSWVSLMPKPYGMQAVKEQLARRMIPSGEAS